MGKFTETAKKRKIQDVSWTVAIRSTDIALLSLFIGLALAMPSKHTGKFLSRLFLKLHESTVDEAKIKNSFYQLKRRGLIDYARNLWQEPKITQRGKQRLEEIWPKYDQVRSWDKHVYLITYDIPATQNYLRNRLRRTLKTLGCGLLQESVWITPYNPKKILEGFAVGNGLSGRILVSDLGKDGSVGEEDIRGLVLRVYRLDELNRRYREFLDAWSGKKIQPETLIHFYSILKDDPQLPFALLPDDWLGESAFEFVTIAPAKRNSQIWYG